MGVLDWLDPTRNWPVVDGPAPHLDRVALQFEGLRFGAPLEAAAFLGRPERFEWRNTLHHDDCDLLYARKGLGLRFTHGKLSEIRFFVGADACDHPDFKPARPLGPDGTPMTPEVDKGRIVALFGEPDPGGSDETCLQIFHPRKVISDFYLDEAGHLKEWSIYPDD